MNGQACKTVQDKTAQIGLKSFKAIKEIIGYCKTI
jgi:hypothetical protein